MVRNISAAAPSTKICIGGTTLPDESEKALLHCLLDKNTYQRVSFKSICDRRPEVFGSPATDLRRQVQKRRDYLVANPEVFQKALLTIIPKEDQDALRESIFPDHSTSSSSPWNSPPPSIYNKTNNRTPFSPLSPPLNTMSHLDKKPNAGLSTSLQGPTYQLFIDQYWKNPNGMFCVRGNEVQVNNAVVDKLTIYKPIFDMDDYDLKLYKAYLTKNGTGITITEPTIPGYLWKNATKIQETIDQDSRSLCQKSEITFKTIRMHLKKNKEYRSHDVTYYFPQDITCNNRYFNGSKKTDGEKQELITDMFVYDLPLGKDSSEDDIIQYCPYIVWRMAIDGEEKQIEDDDEDIRGTDKAFARLGISVGEKKSKKNERTGGGMNDD
jgi:hypothetical protein